MLALIFSLVFVSVKLSGEHGNHLSPSLGEKPCWLMAFPQNHTIATGWLSGFQIHLPGTPPDSSPHIQRRVSGISSWTHSWFSLDVELTGMTKLLVVSLQELSHTWFVAFLTPIGKTKQPFTSIPVVHWLDSNKTPTGLCVSILHNLHLNLNS